MGTQHWTVSYNLALAMGTCHLPLQWLNHVLLQLLTFNTPSKEFRVESRNEALCALGKTGRTGLQMVRYFQELSSCFSSYLRKALKSFMEMTALCESQKTCKKYVLDCTYSSTKIRTVLTSPHPPPLWSRTSQNAVSWFIVLILIQIKFNSKFSHCALFKSAKQSNSNG